MSLSIKAKPERIGSAARKGFRYNISKHRQLYLLLVPGILFFLVYRYAPMFGIIVAFKEYLPWEGVWASEWVGLKHFRELFEGNQFSLLLRNTLIISGLKIFFGFPAPIILALLLNEVRVRWFKRTIQTITYLPNFLSWVIVYGLFYNLFNVTYGLFNEWIGSFGLEPVAILSEPKYFRALIVSSSVWKDVGFSAIIYLAALAGIDQAQYEAAEVDGANRWHLMRHVTIPGLLPTATVLLLLSLGGIMYQDFQQLLVFLGRNPMLLDVGDVFETHVYNRGILNAEYSYGTAVGLFQSLIGMMLVLAANKLTKKLGHTGIW